MRQRSEGKVDCATIPEPSEDRRKNARVVLEKLCEMKDAKIYRDGG